MIDSHRFATLRVGCRADQFFIFTLAVPTGGAKVAFWIFICFFFVFYRWYSGFLFFYFFAGSATDAFSIFVFVFFCFLRVVQRLHFRFFFSLQVVQRWHFGMLNDYERNDAYYKALRNQVIICLYQPNESYYRALRNQLIIYFLFINFFSSIPVQRLLYIKKTL